MAGRDALNRRTRRVLLALVAVVLLGHFAVLHWASGLGLHAGLRPMTPTLYTRVLLPRQPLLPEATPTQAAPPERSRSAATLRRRPARPPASAASAAAAQPASEQVAQAAEPAAAEPATEPMPAASAPQAEASAPATAAASAPAAAASAAAGAASAPSSAEAAGDSWPADTRLRYRLGGHFRSGALYGSARVLWQRQEQRYQVRVEVDVTLLARLVMTSQGAFDASSLRPRAYEEVRNGKPRGLHADEDSVTLDNGKTVPRPAGLQDTASQFVDLSHRFATGRDRLEVGRAVSVWMARPGAVDLWTYDVVEREVLRTQLGDIEAFHLKPRPIANPHGNITAEMWFAPTLQYLPVRIRVVMGEEAAIDLLVEGIDQR